MKKCCKEEDNVNRKWAKKTKQKWKIVRKNNLIILVQPCCEQMPFLHQVFVHGVHIL